MTGSTSVRRGAIAGALATTLALSTASAPDAHKPITSPFTYNDDVFPILRDRCGQCHVSGGVAPMSLLSHEDAIPWGESMRVELLAGHMPPWSVDAGADRFRNAESLTAREMNLLLTWATGGTPYGTPEKAPAPVRRSSQWPLGPPDVQLPFPTEFTLPSGRQEDSVDVVIPTRFTERRALRAVDLLPGTPEIVRSAEVSIRSTAAADDGGGLAKESIVALWLPGDAPVPTDEGTFFELPPGADLIVRVRYKKTWQFERKEMRDRSTVGLYFAPSASLPVRRITLTSGAAQARSVPSATTVFTTRLAEDVRALSIYPGERLSRSSVVVTATGPDGVRREVIAFHPREGWARRYWFREPLSLARGTTIQTRILADGDESSLPLIASPGPARPPAPADVSLTMNLVSVR